MPFRLLVQRGLSSAKHTGVRNLFNRHFVKTGEVPRELAQSYNDLFERRHESDYMDLVRFEESQVHPWISRAEEFVEHVASLVGSGESKRTND